MTFAAQVIEFHRQLKPNWKIPEKIDLIFPFDNKETIGLFETFYLKYFDDHQSRHFLFGINPGRFGAGLTGIPFTDPAVLETICGIPNSFTKRHEISSLFVYDVIDVMGGPAEFYKTFYITSVCPLGFITQGKNCNYYDDKALQRAVEPHIIQNIKKQIQMGCERRVAYSLGQGKNYVYLENLNKIHQFFETIVPLPHPRWVMQYKRKTKQTYIDQYTHALSRHIV